jgi:hypothetical protein
MSHTTRRASTVAAHPGDDWRTQAACTGDTAELFFPVGDNLKARAQADQAKTVCRRCPVREACLSWALETRQDEGVLGGLTEDERRVLHGRRRRHGYRSNAAAHILNTRLEEFTELRNQGLDPLGIAQEMGTNVQTVNNVIHQLNARSAAAEVQAA